MVNTENVPSNKYNPETPLLSAPLKIPSAMWVLMQSAKNPTLLPIRRKCNLFLSSDIISWLIFLITVYMNNNHV